MRLNLILSSFFISVYSDCISDPTTSDCRPFILPSSNVENDLNKLCKSMPGMPGCSLNSLCTAQASLSTEPFCDKFSVLGQICKDMPEMNGCEDYVSMCKPGSIVQQCTTTSPLANLPTTMGTSNNIKSICKEMDMDGCSECAGSKAGTCDLISVYSQLCKAMPDMTQCADWLSLCPGFKSGTPSALPYCAVDGADSPPQMRMYFHTGFRDYVLFKEWVPTTGPQYASTVIAIIFMGIFYELILTIRGHVELDWTAKSSSKLTEYSAQQFKIDSMRAGFQFVESSLAYLLMLVSMTFNVGLFLAVIAGITLGTLVFARFRKYGATKRACGC